MKIWPGRWLAWQLYMASATARLTVWDRLISDQARKLVEQSRLLHRDLPPVIEDDDPIRTDGRIDLNSLFTPVFTKPGCEYVYHIKQRVLMEPEFGFVLI